MNNFNIAQDALETSLNSAGSAIKEHEKWQQSLEAQILKLKAAWQGLSQSFLSSDFLKGALDGVIALVDGITTLIDTFGTIPTLLGVFAAFESFNGVGLFKTIEDEATLSGKRITNIFSDAARQAAKTFQTIGLQTDSSFKASLDDDIRYLSEYLEKTKNNAELSATAFDDIFKNASISAKEFAQSGRLATEGIDGFVQKQKEAQVSILAQNKSLGNARSIIKEYYSGCKNVEMSQERFASAVSKTNPELGKQLTTAKSAKGALAGYTASLVGAKVASFALQAATMALNMALTMGISALVSWGISKLDEWIETADELAEKVSEVTSKFEEQHSQLTKNKASFESEAKRYAELSKGVDQYGNNLSLTSEEYSAYQSAANKIAEQIPTLVKRYDEEGNAILSVKGNVEDLTKAYNDLIIAANNEILTKGEDGVGGAEIFKDFQNKMAETNKTGFWNSLFDNNEELTDVGADALEKILNAENIDEAIDKYAGIGTEAAVEITKAFRAEGYEQNTGTIWNLWTDAESSSDYIKRVIKKNRKSIESVGDNYKKALEENMTDIRSATKAYFSNAFLTDYADIGDFGQDIINQMIPNLGVEFYEQFDTWEEVTASFDSMLDGFKSLGDGEAKELEAAFDLQTRFNGGEISYGEYVKGIQDASKMVDSLGLNEEVESQIKLALNTDEVQKDYDALTKRLVDISTKDLREMGHFSGASDAMKAATEEAKKFLDSLTASEYAVAIELIADDKINLDDFNIDSLRDYIEKQAKINEALNFTIAMDVEVESIEALNTAMAESVSGAGLSSEAIAALKGRYAELSSQGYDLSAMFEETSNGIHLNKNAVSEFEQALASQKLSEIGDENSGALGVLKKRYDELTNEIKNCTDAGERAHLYSEQQEVAQKINDLATLASQYEGLTSAYQAWQSAESAGNERDMYENIISGFETIEDEISRGWYDDGTIKFLELMTGQTDLAGKSASELKKIWNSLDDTIKGTSYSVKDFFTTNEDGESTSTGAYNFLRAVEELGKNGGLKALKGKDIGELVERNSEGKIVAFDFDVVGGDKAIAEALGVSEEMVQIIQRTLDDAGFVVTLDGKYTLLADLKTSAEEANNSLKKLQIEGLKNLKDLDLNFNFDVNTVEGYQEQLEKALNVLDKFRNKDGTLQTDKNGNLVKGAQEALEIAEYYTAAMDKLTEPKFMQIDTSTVDSELQDPIEKMQEIGDLCKEKHLVSLTGDTKELDKVQGEIDKVAKEIEELDPEVKAKIGIDEDWDAKTIADKIEKGEIEVPAELKLDVQMSEDLKDMRLLMMRQLGLVSEEEVKLKIGYEIDESTVDSLTPDEQKVAVEFISENEDWFDKLSDEKKKIVIELIGSGADLSLLEDEEKKVVIEYVEKDTEWFNRLGDEEKKVVIKYVAEHGEIDSWEPEDKEALVRLIVDKDNVDNWKPEDVDAVVKYYADDEQVKDWSPEEKKAFAKYLVDGGEVDGWSPEAKDAFVKYLVDGGDPDKFDPENKESWVVYDTDTTKPDTYNADKNGTVTYDKDSSVPDNYNADKKASVVYNKDSSIPDSYNPDKDGLVIFKKDSSAIDTWSPVVSGIAKFTLSMIVPQSIKTALSKIGISIANGTANVDGSANGNAFSDGTATKLKLIGKSGKAFKKGDWGVKKTETALTGELGPELVVYGNRYWTVGDTGAEFATIPKGAIVFNHKICGVV